MALISRLQIIIFLLSALLLFLLYIGSPAHHHLTMRGRAPLLNCDLPAEYIIPDKYIVYLWPGTSLAQHKAALPNIDFDRAIDHVLPPILDAGGILYRATLNEKALDAVRGDRAHVQLVECNGRVESSAIDDL
jgi:hypothetical protein